MATFELIMILLLLLGFSCVLAIIIIGIKQDRVLLKRELNKGLEQKRKYLVGENVSCANCGKQFETAQMRMFQMWAAPSVYLGATHTGWEEVIPGQIGKSLLSDKLSVKVLCPSCADRFRLGISQEWL